MQTCPHCSRISPPSAERCDCGYDFTKGAMPARTLPTISSEAASLQHLSTDLVAEVLKDDSPMISVWCNWDPIEQEIKGAGIIKSTAQMIAGGAIGAAIGGDIGKFVGMGASGSADTSPDTITNIATVGVLALSGQDVVLIDCGQWDCGPSPYISKFHLQEIKAAQERGELASRVVVRCPISKVSVREEAGCLVLKTEGNWYDWKLAPIPGDTKAHEIVRAIRGLPKIPEPEAFVEQVISGEPTLDSWLLDEVAADSRYMHSLKWRIPWNEPTKLALFLANIPQVPSRFHTAVEAWLVENSDSTKSRHVFVKYAVLSVAIGVYPLIRLVVALFGATRFGFVEVVFAALCLLGLLFMAVAFDARKIALREESRAPLLKQFRDGLPQSTEPFPRAEPSTGSATRPM
jgi:hypothetical protein